MLDMSGWCEGGYCSYAAMQLPALRTRRLPGEMAAAVCRVQVALCLGGFLLHAASQICNGFLYKRRATKV